MTPAVITNTAIAKATDLYFFLKMRIKTNAGNIKITSTRKKNATTANSAAPTTEIAEQLVFTKTYAARYKNNMAGILEL